MPAIRHPHTGHPPPQHSSRHARPTATAHTAHTAHRQPALTQPPTNTTPTWRRLALVLVLKFSCRSPPTAPLPPLPFGWPHRRGLPTAVCVWNACLLADKPCEMGSLVCDKPELWRGAAPRACVRVYVCARVLVPPNEILQLQTQAQSSRPSSRPRCFHASTYSY